MDSAGPAWMDAHARPEARSRAALLRSYAVAGAAVATATGVGALAVRLGLGQSVVLFYLVAILLAGSKLGLGPSLFGALLAATSHAYFFVPPVFGFPTDVGDILAVAAFFLVALVVGSLSARLRVAAETAERRARHAEALREISRALSGADHPADLWPVAAAQAARALGGRALLVLRRTTDAPWLACGEAGPVPVDDVDVHRAEEVIRSGRPAPWADADATTLRLGIPVSDRAGLRGALLVERPLGPAWPPEGLELGEAIGLVTSEAMERVRLADQTQRMEVESRSERLRNALLSSVSHDLRTPLSVIVAATSHLADNGESLAPSERTGLAREAEREAGRLNRLVGNLLSMTRLDAETIRPVKEWQPLEDVVGLAVGRMEKALVGRSVSVHLEPGLPLVPIDALLVEQVLVNLLDNACRHTSASAPVEVRASRSDARRVLVEVLDRGPGIPEDQLEAVFDRHRTGLVGGSQGLGLGLAICRGMVTVHGGRIWAENRPDGGAAFRFTIPLEGEPPALPAEEVEESAAREGAP